MTQLIGHYKGSEILASNPIPSGAARERSVIFQEVQMPRSYFRTSYPTSLLRRKSKEIHDHPPHTTPELRFQLPGDPLPIKASRFSYRALLSCCRISLQR